MNWEEVLKAGMPQRQQRVIEQIMSDGRKRTARQIHDAVKAYYEDKKGRSPRDLAGVQQYQSYMARLGRQGKYQVSVSHETHRRDICPFAGGADRSLSSVCHGFILHGESCSQGAKRKATRSGHAQRS